MKNIKWIFLAILIVLLIIIVILFINYVDDRKKTDGITDNGFVNIYQKKLYRHSYIIYENDELVLEVMSIDNDGYIVFLEETIQYCDKEDVCNSVNYVFGEKNNTITIENNIYYLNSGTYSVNILDDVVELSLENDVRKTVYYLNITKE